MKWSENCSVVSDSLQPHVLYSPWNSLGQNTGVDSLSLLQGNSPTQGSNPGSSALQVDSLPAEPQGKPNVQWLLTKKNGYVFDLRISHTSSWKLWEWTKQIDNWRTCTWTPLKGQLEMQRRLSHPLQFWMDRLGRGDGVLWSTSWN